MSAPMREDRTNAFIEVKAERFEGAPLAGHRRWSTAFKENSVAASLEPGANISALARSLDISPSQLFGWRRLAAKRACEGKPAATVDPITSVRGGKVEIAIGGAVVRVSAAISEEDLRRVLRAVRQA